MLRNIQPKNEKETRGGFGEGIYEVGKKNSNVVVLTADLAGSLKLLPFIKDFPERYFQCGIRGKHDLYRCRVNYWWENSLYHHICQFFYRKGL